MPRYYCQSVDDCVFSLDGVCVYCNRKEPKKPERRRDERTEPPEDADDHPDVIDSPSSLF